ncbi:hypothetical protein Asi03nite_30030 [Actinoplanes siamensis]|uniref:NhaP-type Na+/H+ or K+/H+ antiporter n=1 Tax=Actinoplanes siamensis TaxID=1223317 RepID=A0A919N6X5_9ACTN|nr:hypothetical protein Asi03nite_30030 [Actinoplanes siamensis]
MKIGAPGRLLLMTGTAAAGWLVSVTAGLQGVTGSAAYLGIAGTLLVIGLYSSTYGISTGELRAGVRTVVLAVTVGVLAKAALIAGVMYAVYREPRYAVLGVAVAQIDPLAVAAMSAGSRMSARARSLLAAWAAFDDPITVLLTVYGAAWLIGGPIVGGGATSALLGILQNLALAAAGLALWTLLRLLRRRYDGRAVDAGEILGLVVLLAAAAVLSLALGVALLGLFYRPALDRWVPRITQAAFLSACFLVGIPLAAGIEPGAGLLLGLCAFGAQVVAGLVIPARIGLRDRAYLAAGQQNGITAIILALLLEVAFPGTVGVVAPAILVVAVLYTASNALLDSGLRPRPRPAPAIVRPPRRRRPAARSARRSRRPPAKR